MTEPADTMSLPADPRPAGRPEPGGRPGSRPEGRNTVDATARAVIECAADAIVAFGTDRTMLLWNPAAERMFGWAAAEVIGL